MCPTRKDSSLKKAVMFFWSLALVGQWQKTIVVQGLPLNVTAGYWFLFNVLTLKVVMLTMLCISVNSVCAL